MAEAAVHSKTSFTQKTPIWYDPGRPIKPGRPVSVPWRSSPGLPHSPSDRSPSPGHLQPAPPSPSPSHRVAASHRPAPPRPASPSPASPRLAPPRPAPPRPAPPRPASARPSHRSAPHLPAPRIAPPARLADDRCPQPPPGGPRRGRWRADRRGRCSPGPSVAGRPSRRAPATTTDRRAPAERLPRPTGPTGACPGERSQRASATTNGPTGACHDDGGTQCPFVVACHRDSDDERSRNVECAT
jgi:hypothetical protein